MKLLFDIGNTRLRAAISSNGDLQDAANVVHAGATIEATLAALQAVPRPQEIWLACVAAPEIGTAIAEWGRQRFGIEARFVRSTHTACGVRNAYAEPERLGVDRWLAVIAAHHRARAKGGGAACVASAGTALTFDVVDADGRHRGGLIAPGIGMQRAALHGRTQVRAEKLDGAQAALGVSTDEAVANGTLHSALGLIERAERTIDQTLPLKLRLLTGGDAALLAGELGVAWQLAPQLVLEGLALMAANTG